MATLMPSFNWGSEIKNLNKTLYNQLIEIYSNIAGVLNTKPSTSKFTTDPISNSSTNANFLTGDFWVNESTDMAWILTSRTTANAVT